MNSHLDRSDRNAEHRGYFVLREVGPVEQEHCLSLVRRQLRHRSAHVDVARHLERLPVIDADIARIVCELFSLTACEKP